MTPAKRTCRYCWFAQKLRRPNSFQCKCAKSWYSGRVNRGYWGCDEFRDKKTFLKGT